MKKIMSATVDTSLLKWLDSYSKSNSKYRNKSHMIEVALELLREKECKEEKRSRKR
jgi:Arc/MetJ-type ribon-helix-helix transcriptional regulator